MNMKKFASFLVAGMIVLVVSASARQARVILNSNTIHEVQVDGRNYNGVGTSTITDLSAGTHTVSVYQVISRGIFGIGKKRRQLSFEQFTLRNNDVNIAVNQNGQVRIFQDGYNENKKHGNRNGGYNNDSDGNYGNSEGKGRGHKYGHYKNKKNKHNNRNHKHDDDDDDHDDNMNDRRGDID
jgi:hypothetical protein